MQNNHPTYKIQKGDTIERISERFGVEASVWRKYHNEICPITDMISSYILPSVKEIYLLPELWEKADVLNLLFFVKPDDIVLHNQRLLFHAPENLHNRYGVMLHFKDSAMHYKIDCICREELPDGVCKILLDRRQTYINNQAPDSMLYQIADRMGKAVYPLLLTINRENKIKSLANYNEVVQRCSEAKKVLLQNYAGAYAEKYIRLFEQQYGNPNSLLTHIENELFCRLFFLPLQGAYDDLQKEVQYGFVSGKGKVQTYNLTVTLEPKYTESGKIIARVASKETWDKQPRFEAEYRLYPEDHSIFSIRGKLTDEDGSAGVAFEIFHLNPKERVLETIIPNYEAIYLKDRQSSVPAKKEKSFWNIFK